MSLLGKAALAMWWEVPQEAQQELAHWHAHEHFPERLAIPGFLRASRWTDADGGNGFFVVYELHDHAVLASAPHVARLNAPTPWSTRMMPLHQQMVRTQCRVVHSRGALTARHALTVRCAPAPGQAEALPRALGDWVDSAWARPGIVGLHVLQHAPPALAVTAEQVIRGNADRAADWVLVASGYDRATLQALAQADLGEPGLQAMGAAPQAVRRLHALAYSATPPDMH